jgi:sphinganine-1-phosphate aldolase
MATATNRCKKTEQETETMSDRHTTLPASGRSYQEILDQMRAYSGLDPDYKKGRTWSLVYYLGEEYTRFLEQAHNMFFSANGLNPMAFQSLKRFEHEVVRMTANLLNGDDHVCGVMTSGGTESCLLAVKTCRDMARSRRPWIRRPEMILPDSAHVAWEKAAGYFGVKAVHAPLDRDYRVDVEAVASMANRKTIMLLGSAPQYPHGVVDPIEALGEIALAKKIPLHVDACVGGYLLPFVERLGHPVPPFDFRVPGVTSISADTHKYGYAAKGASTILYRSMDYLKHQFFVFENWPGGVFASPALLGTRPGGSIAAAWAALQAMGQEGYLDNARRIMETTRLLKEGVSAIDGLRILGDPPMSLFAFASTDPRVAIFAVGDRMEARGWHLDRQQRPECLHAMVTPLHAQVVDGYLEDLRASVAEVRENPDLAEQGSAAMYGMIANVPLRGVIRKNVMKMMMDMYGPQGRIPDLAEAAGKVNTEDAGVARPAKTDLAMRLGRWFLRARRRRRGGRE